MNLWGNWGGLGDVDVGEIEIVKSFLNMNKTKNYIIDVNNTTKQVLIEKSKIIIQYNRVRIQNYVPINRCYKCQQFGHVAFNCRNKQICGGCGDLHDTRNCTSDKIICVNCKGPDYKH